MQRSNDKPRKLELLAPAKDCEIAREAIIHGADAVYIGADAFGARASATNSTADIARLVDFAHAYNARIYVTLNTLIYDSELAKAERLIRDIYRAGADALIVQDMSVLRMDIPPIALHASTQCDTRTPAKARFLEDCGFSQIVLARELSFGEIKQISQATTVPLEAFVHGALCVSYSGDCQASLLSTGRSANRGECAQMCRLNYRLTDSEGNPLAADAHYLSLRDMNRLDRLGDLADAGVSSFKIEGRLKDSAYVRNVVAAYSLALDKLIAASDGAYVRASSGEVSLSLQPDVERSFNRRFTNYFLDGRPANGQKMSSLDSPKWIGNKVATVIRANGNRIEVNAIEKLSNGDGLGYFGADGKFKGFRLNRVEGRTIHTLSPLGIAPGTVLYRNRDKRLDDRMTSPTAERRIRLDAMLRRVDSRRVALQLTDENGLRAEATAEIDFQRARTPQSDNRRRTLAKLGDTIFKLRNFDDLTGDMDFIAASQLADLRRSAVALLIDTRKAAYSFDYRRPEQSDIEPFKAEALDYHDNVANRLSEEFFRSHGIAVAQRALEASNPRQDKDFRVMKTRYCLRRELGACLRSPSARKLPTPLFLHSADITFRLDFDCSNCEMHVIRPASQAKH